MPMNRQPDTSVRTPHDVTTTSTRRHRPSTKAQTRETASDRRGRTDASARKSATRGSKSRAGSAGKKASARREEKSDSPIDVASDARVINLKKAEPNDVRRKGKSTHELESTSAGRKPTRKSTRGGANHAKPDSQLRRRQMRRVRSPERRHGSRAG